jgi:hypothetical protein|tara:strand:- start:307 stop:465 length:159 start_codon:yes stop_codon:yes gene_type:complete
MDRQTIFDYLFLNYKMHIAKATQYIDPIQELFDYSCMFDQIDDIVEFLESDD